MNIEDSFCYEHYRFSLHYGSGKLVQTSDSGWDGVGAKDGELGMGKFTRKWE